MEESKNIKFKEGGIFNQDEGILLMVGEVLTQEKIYKISETIGKYFIHKSDVHERIHDWVQAMGELGVFDETEWEGEDEIIASINSYIDGNHKKLQE